MAGPWEKYGGQQTAEQPSQTNAYPGIIRGNPKPVDPMKVEQRDYSRQTDQRDYATDRDDTAFSESGSLRKEFRSLASVKEYDTALAAFNSSLSTQDNPQGDQSLITSYAKMLDPTSAVREGEFATTAQTENYINQVKARLAKEFGFENGGMVTPEGREFIRKEMWNLVNKRFRPKYDRDRADYTGYAQEFGYNPNIIVGTDLITPYENDFSAYLNPQPEQALSPTTREVFADGAQFGMDTFGQDDAFDRSQYLSEEYGVGAGDEALIAAFWNKNRNNDSLTPDQVAAWYQDQGIPLPSDADIINGVEYAKKGYNFGNFDTEQAEKAYTQQLDAAIDEKGIRPEGLGDTIGGKLAQGVALGFGDELQGVVGAAGAALSGGNVGAAYEAERDIVRRQLDRSAEANPGTSLAAELGGGLATGFSGAGRSAARGGMTVARATKEGAAIGAVGGFGYGEGAGGSAVNALGGAALGAGLGAGAQKIGNALAVRAANKANPEASAIARAGEAEGVTVNRAMVDKTKENVFSGVETTRAGGPRINREMDKVQGQIEGRVRSLGSGSAPEQEALGSVAQKAVSRRSEKAGTVAGRLYEKADEAAGGVRIKPQNAIAEIDTNIAALRESGAKANRGQIQYLQDIRSDIAGGISVRGLRDQRTGMRGQINERNLGQTDAERRVGLIMDAAAKDIAEGLANNPKASRLYTRADKIWRERADFRKQIEQDIIGPANKPKSGTQAARKLESYIRDDAPRFQRLWSSLDDVERSELSGYMAEALGRNAKGEFSPAIFLNQLPGGSQRKLSDRSAKILFGESGSDSLANLKTLATEVNRLNGLRNTSNTARSNTYQNWVFETVGLLGGGLGGLASGSGGFGTTATALAGAGLAAGARGGRDVITARMLTSPKISKWLATAPKTTNPKAIDAHYSRLGKIAKAEPALAGEIEILQNVIMRAANDNAGRMSSVAEDSAQQMPNEQN